MSKGQRKLQIELEKNFKFMDEVKLTPYESHQIFFPSINTPTLHRVSLPFKGTNRNF